METIVIEVYLPAAGRTFDVRVPRAMNSLLAAHLTADALASLSDGAYLSSRTSLFAWRESGKLLAMGHSLEQEHVRNGSRLLLV